MKPTVVLRFFCCVFCLSGCLLKAQHAADDPIKKSLKPDSLLVPSASGLALPIVFFSPETQTAGGIVGIYYFRLPGSFATSRASNIKGDAIYTQLGQLFLQVQPQIYLLNETYFIDADFSFIRFADKFWGIGNSTDWSQEEKYKNEIVRARLSLFRQIVAQLNFGIQFNSETYTMIEVKENGLLDTDMQIIGRNGSKSVGLGAMLNFDSRDNTFSPKHGGFYQLSAMSYSKSLGGTNDFWLYTIDVRKYIEILPEQILALQGYLSFVSGDAPFQMLPRLGGNSRMRGFYEGRFRDKQVFTVQSEFRRPLFWRIGGVAFIAAGSVSERHDDINWRELKFAYGIGLRFAITPEERVFARVDFGGGANTYGFYVQVNEAF